jgi:prepilin-type N-terminal cleavage/methylation domain-containing protein
MKKYFGPIVGGFTLVELLIVIALIAILSVAVLATINPIEQSNKAKDSTVQNDAAEVLNAYERYYAAQSSYPWVDVVANPAVTVDSVMFLNSSMAGFALCTVTAGVAAPTDTCALRNAPGLLLTTTELKDSFLEKNYTKSPTNQAAAPAFTDMLYLIKEPVGTGNSIHVCFVPKAKANRTVNSKLKKLAVAGNSAATWLPTTYTDTVAGDFVSGYPDPAIWTFTTVDTSLFKCVP